ncbi:MAG: threonine--tRNA ligase, partial [Dehalococcoidia bacterium]
MADGAIADKSDVDEEEWLRRMRHSAAHVLAQVVLELFPDAKIAIGPPIDVGFYYDFLLPRTLTPEDLQEIERRMKKEIKRGHRFVWQEVPQADARARFSDQPFKLELIDEFTQDADAVGLCTHAGFTDLCRGGHVGNTRQIGPFTLTSVAGAYWRGDENRPQLQRVYGALFANREQLDAHFHRLQEAARRDHRKLGRELGLFTFSDDIGAGIPLFLPKGEIIRHTMEQFVRDLQTQRGFQHVWTGHLAKGQLYHRSGHLPNYQEFMFPAMVDGDTEIYLKPMNCPSHMVLYNAEFHSYRDLPLRYAEFATLYRYEKSGELTGLTRVRSVTQDDCHLFCTPAQVQSEFALCLDLVRITLDTYGLADYRVALSLPSDETPPIGTPEQWQQAVAALRQALDASGLPYDEEVGAAAFYGPKADFFARDVLGREWQLSTIQVDFIQPQRMGCQYVGEDGARHTPVVLHRAVIGSTERFLGILIEHYEGNFPAWLAPLQARLIPIADRHLDYARTVADRLAAAGLRADVDD